MASESTGGDVTSDSIPAELDEWLAQQAEEIGIDRETLFIQLLSAYREITTDPESLPAGQGDLSERMDSLESDYKQQLKDVRNRVIQVKAETDERAPVEHEHEELETLETQLDELSAQLGALEADLESVETQVTEVERAQQDHRERTEQFESETEGRLDTVEERLQTVAWIVRDLRETVESGGGLTPVDRIKRAAAKADVERAKCEHCGEMVAIALLTDPECPHCESAVGNVEPASGWFGKPVLRGAAQLESGEE